MILNALAATMLVVSLIAGYLTVCSLVRIYREGL